MHIDGVTVRHEDPRQLSDEDLVKVNAFGNVLRAESKPDEPPTPLEVTTQGVRNIPSFVEVHGWRAARDGDSSGEIIAAAEAMIPHTGENEHMLQAGVKVHPEHRRQGLAWRLLEEVVALAEANGKRLLLSSTNGKVPAGQAFAERLGAKPGLVHRTSELALADVDRSTVERWVAEAPGRAPGYELVLFEGAYPEAEYAELIACLDVMNTAPREDLEIEDQHMTPEQFAEIEKAMAAQGVERWAAFVRHTESGEYVAFSDLYWHPANPTIINQGGTGVLPEHRGHALGKWVKAVLILKALDERPEAKLIRTSNAYTNDAMLGINNELGFVEKFSETIWQLEVAQARKVLAKRPPGLTPDWTHPRVRAIAIGLAIGLSSGIVLALLLRDERDATERFACPIGAVSVSYVVLEPIGAPPVISVTPIRIERRVPNPAGGFATEGVDGSREEFERVVRATCDEHHPVRRPTQTVGGNAFLRVTTGSGETATLPMKDRPHHDDPTMRVLDELSRRHFGAAVR